MSEDDPKPKRRGRPPAPEDKKRRHNLTFRIRSDLREQIEISAREKGRSMSEEIEYLIERSLERDNGLVKALSESINSNFYLKHSQFSDKEHHYDGNYQYFDKDNLLDNSQFYHLILSKICNIEEFVLQYCQNLNSLKVKNNRTKSDK